MNKIKKIKKILFFLLIFFNLIFGYNIYAVFKDCDVIIEDYAVDALNSKNGKKKVRKQGRKPEDEEIFNRNVDALDCSSQNGAILMDARTNDILYANKANLIAPMASTTKIMTAILAIENTKDVNKFYKVNEDAIKVQGSSMGLDENDCVNMRGLLTGMMLSSGNDAANEIAFRVIKELIKENKVKPLEEKYENNVVKHIEKFVELMNEKARELGLKNTKFSSPSGLGPEDVTYSKEYNVNETTAKDLAILSSYAMKNKLFKKICSLSKASVKLKKACCKDECEKKSDEEKRWYYNHNKLLIKGGNRFYKYACGIKTGFTKEAGRCLVASAKKDGVVLIAVVLSDPEDWTDCRKLFNYGFSKYSNFKLPEDFEISEELKNKEFKIIGSEGKDEFFKVVQEEPMSVKLTENIKKNNEINYKIKANSVYFTVSDGEKIGEIEYYLNDDYLIGKSNLIAEKIKQTNN